MFPGTWLAKFASSPTGTEQGAYSKWGQRLEAVKPLARAGARAVAKAKGLLSPSPRSSGASRLGSSRGGHEIEPVPIRLDSAAAADSAAADSAADSASAAAADSAAADPAAAASAAAADPAAAADSATADSAAALAERDFEERDEAYATAPSATLSNKRARIQAIGSLPAASALARLISGGRARARPPCAVRMLTRAAVANVRAPPPRPCSPEQR